MNAGKFGDRTAGQWLCSYGLKEKWKHVFVGTTKCGCSAKSVFFIVVWKVLLPEGM